MKEFNQVLFPVDFSESSEKIVPYVQTIAKIFNSEIHVLFVARGFDYFSSIYVPPISIDQFRKEIIEGAEKRLDEFLDQHFREFPDAKGMVVSGDASEEIINYVKTKGIDLVIMGTHGRKSLNEVIFGSVSDRVVKTSPVPVMVVNPHKVTS
jgi:nucleotide-binding universal stress UspA family protein